MKITVRINEFKRLLEEASYVAPKKAELRILEFVKIDVHGSRATILAADLGKNISQQFELVDSDADNSFLLPPEKMRHFLKRHVGGTATIETDPENKSISVMAGQFTMQISLAYPTMTRRGLVAPSFASTSTYPEFWPMPDASHEVSLKFLKRVIEQVESACPNKDQEKAVACVKLESDGTRIRAVATDGFRIGIAEALGSFGVFDLQLPKTFLPVLLRRQGSVVKIAASEISYFFRTENVLLECSKPTTKFPKYEKALSMTGWKSTVRVASKDLKTAIFNVLSTFTATRPAIILAVRGDSLQVSTANSNEITTGSVKVSTEGEQEAKIKVNPHFLMPFLSQTEGEITLQFTDDFLRLSKDECQFLVFRMTLEPGKEAVSERHSSVDAQPGS
jgi:DNA polymerase III sliding clamp (beta) subunit (PCNA family)